jgi:hypothetical protein
MLYILTSSREKREDWNNGYGWAGLEYKNQNQSIVRNTTIDVEVELWRGESLAFRFRVEIGEEKRETN